MSKIKFKFLNLILSTILLLCITGCQGEKQETSIVDNKSEKEATVEIESNEQLPETESVKSDIAETISSSQTEETETLLEADIPEEAKDIIENEYFSVYLDSMTEEDENVTMTFIFTNVSDISYYKGDEEYHPGDSWEKVIRFTRDKWKNFDNAYLHYKLCNSSIYDPDVQVIFSGGARFEMDENLNILVFEIFEDVPVQTE